MSPNQVIADPPLKPVRLPASATLLLPRWGLVLLCLLYILPGLFGRDPWKFDDASGFGIMWTMAHGGLNDWLWPHVVGQPMPEEGPLAFWLGAICIKLFGWLLSDALAARIAPICYFMVGAISVWRATYRLGRRAEAQPMQLAFGGQPKPDDYGRVLADGALLIYIGCIGLLLNSHETRAEALFVSLSAFLLYMSVRYVEAPNLRKACMLGVALGCMALTRGWIVPLGLWVSFFVSFRLMKLGGRSIGHLMAAFVIGVLILSLWLFTAHIVRPFNSTPYDAWMGWNLAQLSWPSYASIKFFLKNSTWFFWPAWPFAIRAIYAWRRQYRTVHILLPLSFTVALIIISLLDPSPEESSLLPLLPPLAVLAALGLPTMRRGAINAVDWFSVMTLTTCAAFIWVGWIAKQTGWPAQIAKNAFKLAPGFKPEFSLIAFAAAAIATLFWIILVYWRVSRQPAVLWRAVVLSSGGVILCWLLLTTLWMPWINYGKSYASVAQDISQQLPESGYCVETNVSSAQRASFAYLGGVRFSGFNDTKCEYVLLQAYSRKRGEPPRYPSISGKTKVLWEGHRPSDRDESFSLFQRVK